jgi:hypothetical protein
MPPKRTISSSSIFQRSAARKKQKTTEQSRPLLPVREERQTREQAAAREEPSQSIEVSSEGTEDASPEKLVRRRSSASGGRAEASGSRGFASAPADLSEPMAEEGQGPFEATTGPALSRSETVERTRTFLREVLGHPPRGDDLETVRAFSTIACFSPDIEALMKKRTDEVEFEIGKALLKVYDHLF